MKERLKRLPIFDINNGLYPAIDPYPIQPYQMSVNDYTGLPSPLYENIISCYHQVQSIKDRKDDAIYPSKGCAIVCILGNNKARSVLVGSPTIPRIAEYRYPDCVYFVAIFRLDVGYSIFLDFINESIDTHIPLEKIFPAVTPRFTEEMEAAVSFLQRVYIFENFLNQLLTNHTPIPVQHKRLINKISNFSDSSLANATGKLISSEFSSRHVRRLCVRYVGITPK